MSTLILTAIILLSIVVYLILGILFATIVRRLDFTNESQDIGFCILFWPTIAICVVFWILMCKLIKVVQILSKRDIYKS